MLAVIGAESAKLHPGSLALGIARLWAKDGQEVVLVDADTTGSALANRFGAATRASYSPTERGIPSMIAARQPLTLGLLANHCYNLDASEGQGSVWVAFGPPNVSGGALTTKWLADHADQLLNLDRGRPMILAGSLLTPLPSLNLLIQASSILAMVAPAESEDDLESVHAWAQDAELHRAENQYRLLIAEGKTSMSSADIRDRTGFHLVGRLSVIEDAKVLRLQKSRRERAFMDELEEVSSRLLKVHRAARELPVDEDPSLTNTDRRIVPVVAEPESEPVVPVVAEPESEPVVPVVAEPESEPVVPVVAESEPVVPVVAEPESEPVVPVVAESEPVVPVVAEPESEPVVPVVAESEPVVPVVAESEPVVPEQLLDSVGLDDTGDSALADGLLETAESHERSKAPPLRARMDGMGGALVLPGGAVLLLAGGRTGVGIPVGIGDLAQVSDLGLAAAETLGDDSSITADDSDGPIVLPGGVRLDGVGGALVLPAGAVLLLAGKESPGDSEAAFQSGDGDEVPTE